MARFSLNRRTCQFEMTKPVPPTAEEVFSKVKRVYARTMHTLGISDQHIKDQIKAVQSGTVNINYLMSPEYRKYATYRQLCEFIIRELSN